MSDVGSVANILFHSFSYGGCGHSSGDGDVQGQAFRQIGDPALHPVVFGLQSQPPNLEEMMAERGNSVDHATIHRWVIRYSPELLQRFNTRKRVVTRKWHVDETYIKVRGR
jgi:hypothetical protein